MPPKTTSRRTTTDRPAAGQTWQTIATVGGTSIAPGASQTFHDDLPASGGSGGGTSGGDSGDADPAPEYRAAGISTGASFESMGGPLLQGPESDAAPATDFAYTEDFENGPGNWSGSTFADQYRPADQPPPAPFTPNHWLGLFNDGDQTSLAGFDEPVGSGRRTTLVIDDRGHSSGRRLGDIPMSRVWHGMLGRLSGT